MCKLVQRYALSRTHPSASTSLFVISSSRSLIFSCEAPGAKDSSGFQSLYSSFRSPLKTNLALHTNTSPPSPIFFPLNIHINCTSGFSESDVINVQAQWRRRALYSWLMASDRFGNLKAEMNVVGSGGPLFPPLKVFCGVQYDLKVNVDGEIEWRDANLDWNVSLGCSAGVFSLLQ